MLIIQVSSWVASCTGTLSTEKVNCKSIQVFLNLVDIATDMGVIGVVI